MRFKDKIVVISGGSSGIGLASVKLFSDEGAIIYILDIKPILNSYKNVYYFKCDISSFEEVNQIIKEISKKSKIDIIVANAGIYHVGTVEELTDEIIDKVLGVNLKGPINLLRAVLPVMRIQNKGNIILIGSDQCFIGKSNSSIYGASKGAIAQLTKSTAIDYAKYNINVNCICPGTIDTPLIEEVVNIWQNKFNINKNKILEMFRENHLFKRIGKPEEIAKVIAFVASCDSSFMTGSLIPVDGGYTSM